MARRHPGQVACILIRNVSRDSADSARYRAAFHGVDPGHWHLFNEPEELSWPM
jgi:phosphatidate phosphatase APP1